MYVPYVCGSNAVNSLYTCGNNPKVIKSGSLIFIYNSELGFALIVSRTSVSTGIAINVII